MLGASPGFDYRRNAGTLARSKQAGISDDEIEQIKDGSRRRPGDPLDNAIMVSVEEFHADTFVSDDTWKTLAKHLDEHQLFELLVLIGQFFANVAFVLNSLKNAARTQQQGIFCTIAKGARQPIRLAAVAV